VSPIILILLIITYSLATIKHFIGVMKYGGELITYKKDDPKRMQDIFNLLKNNQK
jgi:hypothetical protein